MTNIKMKVSDFKQDDNIHAITHRIGKLAAYDILQYRLVKDFKGDSRFDVYDKSALDYAEQKTNTIWSILGIEELFCSLPFSKDSKHKALAKICLFSYATKKEAVAKINEIKAREFIVLQQGI